MLISVGQGLTEFHQKLQIKCDGNTASGFWFAVESRKDRYVIYSRQTDVEWAIQKQSPSQNNTKLDLTFKCINFICTVARVLAKGTEFVRMCSCLPPVDHSLPWKQQYCKDFQKLETTVVAWPGDGLVVFWVLQGRSHLCLLKAVEQHKNLYHYQDHCFTRKI